MSLDLQDRYGKRRGRGTLLVVVSVLVAVVGLAWLAWAAWFHSTAGVRSDLLRYSVEDSHRAVVTVHVHLDDGVEGASCKVRALAEDHSVVGEANWTPHDGANEVDLRTARKAASIDLVGCTAADQSRPR